MSTFCNNLACLLNGHSDPCPLFAGMARCLPLDEREREQKPIGENLKVVRAEFSTLSLTVLLLV